MDFQRHRPEGYGTIGEARLPRLADELTERLATHLERESNSALRLSKIQVVQLGRILVEFYEDLHCDIGIWRSLERLNRSLFGTPLPLIYAPEESPERPALVPRLRHLLWNLYAFLTPDLILSPADRRLEGLAVECADFLVDRFRRYPRLSGIKQYLGRRDRYGWDVKRKLIWLGRDSYLFRLPFSAYVRDRGDEASIPVVDDFVCQAATLWSGLGVREVLAEMLGLKGERRRELLSWSERHLAYYRVERVRRSGLKLTNLLTNAPYQVQMDGNGNIFRPGQIVLGSLAPWNGRWYWSGTQSTFDEPSSEELDKILQRMRRKATQALFRYDEASLARAQTLLVKLKDRFRAMHGDDLVVFPDGQSLAAAMLERYRKINEETPTEKREEILARYDMDSAAPNAAFDQTLLENENGVGLFFNPEEGDEIMTGFYDVQGALAKGGQDLSEDEVAAMHGFMESKAISPAFVRRVVREYGEEAAASIAVAYRIEPDPAHPILDYLLRRYKGEYYRARYPHVSFPELGATD